MRQAELLRDQLDCFLIHDDSYRSAPTHSPKRLDPRGDSAGRARKRLCLAREGFKRQELVTPEGAHDESAGRERRRVGQAATLHGRVRTDRTRTPGPGFLDRSANTAHMS
jgi:hypothetical protein